MEIQVIFSSVAAQEVRKSFEWYEEHLEGLGNRFVDVVDKTIQFILILRVFHTKRNPKLQYKIG